MANLIRRFNSHTIQIQSKYWKTLMIIVFKFIIHLQWKWERRASIAAVFRKISCPKAYKIKAHCNEEQFDHFPEGSVLFDFRSQKVESPV